MKTLFYIFLIVMFAKNSFSQVMDTCYVDEIVIYHVKNKQQNSYLYWEITGGKITSENPSKTDSIEIFWDTAGIYELYVFEKTANNCNGKTVTSKIMVLENDFGIKLYIPNVFTPNGDRTNDYFTVKANIPPENYNITILNRWGNKVFETANINNSWDGKTNNKYCSPGVYFYIIQYKNGKEIETKNGVLHIFR